jgi:hypothetical protein
MFRKEDVHFPAEGGIELSAWLFVPEHRATLALNDMSRTTRIVPKLSAWQTSVGIPFYRQVAGGRPTRLGRVLITARLAFGAKADLARQYRDDAF